MNEPRKPDPDDILRGLRAEREVGWRDSTLCESDRKYLRLLLEALHRGAKAVVIVETDKGQLKYMFSNASRLEAIGIIARVVGASAEKEQGES